MISSNNMTHEFKTPISTISLAARCWKIRQWVNLLLCSSIFPGVIMMKPNVCVSSGKKYCRCLRSKAEGNTEDERGECKWADSLRLILSRLEGRKYNGKIPPIWMRESDIFVDEMHFTNVISNLLDNAVKYKNRKENWTVGIYVHGMNQVNFISR